MPVPVDPALEPLTVPVHVEAPADPGPASLAMAIGALEPDRDVHQLHDEIAEPDTPSPGVLALAALRRGFHAILYGPVEEPERLETAREAGLVHRREAAGVREVTAALEAGRPALALVDRAELNEASPSGPHWICLVDHDEDEVRYHDPIVDDGPDAVAWETLAGAMGYGTQRLLLEVGPLVREDR